MEFSEKLADWSGGLRERLKSSFLLTFIAIWCIHHWRLLFMLLNFDDGLDLDRKLEALDSYFSKAGFWRLWFVPVLWTFTSLFFYYLFSVISELLNIGFQNSRKFIYQQYDSKKLAMMADYEHLQRRFDTASKRNRELTLENYDLLEERKVADRQVTDAQNKAYTLANDNDSLRLRVTTLETEIGQNRLTKNELEKQLAERKNFIKLLGKRGFVFNELVDEADLLKAIFVDWQVTVSGDPQGTDNFIAKDNSLVSTRDPQKRWKLHTISKVGLNRFQVALELHTGNSFVSHVAIVNFAASNQSFVVQVGGRVFTLSPPD